ncbi:MAG: hypothetical protein ABSH56_36080 [Bryobacteraceae bacterium]|jgi:hypothetical protein
MSSDHDRLQPLVDMGEQVIVDTETAARLDASRARPGEDLPFEEVWRRLGLRSI